MKTECCSRVSLFSTPLRESFAPQFAQIPSPRTRIPVEFGPVILLSMAVSSAAPEAPSKDLPTTYHFDLQTMPFKRPAMQAYGPRYSPATCSRPSHPFSPMIKRSASRFMEKTAHCCLSEATVTPYCMHGNASFTCYGGAYGHHIAFLFPERLSQVCDSSQWVLLQVRIRWTLLVWS